MMRTWYQCVAIITGSRLKMTSANTRTCTVCKKEFERPKRKKDAARCCSRECGFKYIRDTRRERWLTENTGKQCFAEWRNCLYCESAFLCKVETVAYCSIPCGSKANTIAGVKCVDCGKKREHYSQRCAECKAQHARRMKRGEVARRIRKAAKAKRRARKMDVIAAPVSLQDVLNAHGKKCHICGSKVDDSTTNQPLSATMDHVVPLALGGWHDLCNLRPAHHACNSLKGASYSGQLMLVC